MKLNRMFVTAAAFSFTLGISSYVLAQDQRPAPAPQEQQAPAKSMTVQGELVKVDADAKTITVKATDGSEVQFTYNDKTEVKGAGESVAGLATQAGSKVSVDFTTEGSKKIATRIEVQSKQ